MRTLINKLLRNKSGATVIEYGLIAALISIAVIAGATIVGSQLKTTFGDVGTALTTANTANAG